MTAYQHRILYPLVGPLTTRSTPDGIPVAAAVAMLLAFLVAWAVLVVCVCAVFAAGGGADDRREKWNAELTAKKGSEKDAA
jgi:hypothetical protein